MKNIEDESAMKDILQSSNPSIKDEVKAEDDAEPKGNGIAETEDSNIQKNNSVSSKKPKRHKPGFHLEMFKETSYYFQGGMRYVYPYSFTFTAHVKGRWLNMSILELFSKEFHMETMDYYKKAIIDGKIRVNSKPVSFDTILSNNNILETLVHRHEPPVINEAIEFLRHDKDMVVINKPPSIPVHPCGRYRHNTIVFILGKEHGLHGLHTIHRIDRLTSGVLMFAKTITKAKEIEHQIHKEGNVEKEYLARVVGEFPDEEITVDEPIITASHKIGVCHVHKDGKTCLTKFKRLSFNGKSSVVSCKPHQGRMHQIRVHLQWVGHPIVNDPIYNHPTAWTEKVDGNNYDMDVVIKELLRTRKDKSYEDELSTDKPNTTNYRSARSCDADNEDDHGSAKRRKLDCSEKEVSSNENLSGDTVTINKTDKEDITNNAEAESTESNCNDENMNCGKLVGNIAVRTYDKNTSFTCHDIGEEYVDEDCTDCKRVWRKPSLSEMVMYLHSLHYKGPDWEYKTSIPKWAKEDWVED